MSPISRLAPLLILLLVSTPAAAQVRTIDPARSTVTIRVGKSGMFSAFGHEHEVRGPITQGSVQDSGAEPKVEVVVRSGDLKVLDPGVKESDRAEIQSTMLGPKVLDAVRFPEIRFRSTRVERAGNGWKIEGELTLRSQTRPVTVTARGTGDHYTAISAFKQSEFGITPVTAGGGTVKVKDEIRLEFEITLK